ncbi:GL14470 [Drosophila persimilis]|uniref:GL14470 n=1 Tax=Drosophila persimilis TaxID=7234 RepID=B4GQC9_DROPE|nr:GL14470 [Drosophila persimilis]
MPARDGKALDVTSRTNIRATTTSTSTAGRYATSTFKDLQLVQYYHLLCLIDVHMDGGRAGHA